MWLITWLRVHCVIAQLAHHPSPMARAVAQALNAVLTRTVSPEEQRAITQIESLRKALNRSSDHVLVYYEGGSARECTVGEICQRTGQPRRWALLLFQLIRAVRPRRCLEMGTSVGISAAYQAAALEFNQQGTLVTLEGAPNVARLAEAHLRQLGLGRVSVKAGRFQTILGTVLADCAPIDFVFIDGHHDERATLAYLEQIIPYLTQPAIVVFDDIHWSEGMARAWNTITADERLPVTIELEKLGIGIFDPSASPPRHVRVDFP